MCLHKAKTKGSQFDRRNLVRSTFAAGEGITWALKRYALQREVQGHFSFPPGDRALLSEMNYELDASGHVNERPARLTLKANIRFAVSAFVRANHLPFDLTTDGGEWEAFGKAIKIRDRLMHPKSLADIHVSDEELAVVQESIEWWVRTIDTLYRSVIGDQHP
jgi:hypothetical protein